LDGCNQLLRPQDAAGTGRRFDFHESGLPSADRGRMGIRLPGRTTTRFYYGTIRAIPIWSTTLGMATRLAPHNRWGNCYPTLGACMTWEGMCGSGVEIGMVLTRAELRRIRKGGLGTYRVWRGGSWYQIGATAAPRTASATSRTTRTTASGFGWCWLWSSHKQARRQCRDQYPSGFVVSSVKRGELHAKRTG